MNLFKTKKPNIVKTATVDQIHNEFYNEGTRLLGEADEILKKEVSIRGKRLDALGFSNMKEASIANEIEEEQYGAQRQANLIVKYQEQHPLYRFITYPGVRRICNKYGLHCIDPRDYIGNIPEKNLLEIENFKRYQRSKKMTCYYDCNSWGEGRYLTKEQYIDYQKNGYGSVSPGDCLSICCPPSDIRKEYFDEKKRQEKLRLEDPVVLFPTGDGYLIISAWGPEASDEELMNPKNN